MAPPPERPDPPSIPNGTTYNTLDVGASREVYLELGDVDLSPPSSGVKAVTIGFSYQGSGDVARYIKSNNGDDLVLLDSQGNRTSCKLGSSERAVDRTFSRGQHYAVRIYVAADGRGWIQCADGTLVEGRLPSSVTLVAHAKRLQQGASGTFKVTDPKVDMLNTLPFKPSGQVAAVGRDDNNNNSNYAFAVGGMNVNVTTVDSTNKHTNGAGQQNLVLW